MIQRLADFFLGCHILGHRPETVVETWKTWGISKKKHRGVHRKHRRTFVRCARCGKELE